MLLALLIYSEVLPFWLVLNHDWDEIKCLKWKSEFPYQSEREAEGYFNSVSYWACHRIVCQDGFERSMNVTKCKLKLTTFDIAHHIKDWAFSGALHNNCSKGQLLFCVTPVWEGATLPQTKCMHDLCADHEIWWNDDAGWSVLMSGISCWSPWKKSKSHFFQWS